MRGALRRRDARHVYEQHVGPSMTPMVDVTLVILIFFMAAAAIAGPELLIRLGVRAEGVGEALLLPPAEFRVELRREGSRLVVDGMGLTAASLDRLETAVASVATRTDGAGLVVVLSGSEEVTFGEIVEARDVIERAGISSIELD